LRPLTLYGRLTRDSVLLNDDLEDLEVRIDAVGHVKFVAFYEALMAVGVSDTPGRISVRTWWARWCHHWLHLWIIDPEDQVGHEEILS
jgi:hypothetical protein